MNGSLVEGTDGDRRHHRFRRPPTDRPGPYRAAPHGSRRFARARPSAKSRASKRSAICMRRSTGEITAVNEALADDLGDPFGRSVRQRLDDQAQSDRSVLAGEPDESCRLREALRGRGMSTRDVSLHHARSAARDAADDRRGIDRRAVRPGSRRLSARPAARLAPAAGRNGSRARGSGAGGAKRRPAAAASA